MLTVNEVAARLKVSKSTIYNAVESGSMPHYRIGVGRGAIRISEEQLEAFLLGSLVEEGSATKLRPRDVQYRGKPK